MDGNILTPNKSNLVIPYWSLTKAEASGFWGIALTFLG